MRTQDLTGQKFNFLTALKRVGVSKNKAQTSLWECQCDCGNTTIIQMGALKNGTIKSCGCKRGGLISAARTIHGMDGTDIYRIWIGMFVRCTNHKAANFASYGGRGISVCKRWLDFKNFMVDMGERPEGMSLDRIDNDADYSPKNCRWATPKQQANNRRVTIRLTRGGVSKTIGEWAQELGIPRTRIDRRHRAGMSEYDIFRKESFQGRR